MHVSNYLYTVVFNGKHYDAERDLLAIAKLFLINPEHLCISQPNLMFCDDDGGEL